MGARGGRRLVPPAPPGSAGHLLRGLRSRHGRRHVRVCTATACFAASAGRQLLEVENALGVAAGTDADPGAARCPCRRCAASATATRAPRAWTATTPCAGPGHRRPAHRARTTLRARDPGAPMPPVSRWRSAGIVAGRGRLADLARKPWTAHAGAGPGRGGGLRTARARRRRLSGGRQVGGRGPARRTPWWSPTATRAIPVPTPTGC